MTKKKRPEEFLQTKLTDQLKQNQPIVNRQSHFKTCPCCKSGQMITLLTFGRRGMPIDFYKTGIIKNTFSISKRIWVWVVMSRKQYNWQQLSMRVIKPCKI